MFFDIQVYFLRISTATGIYCLVFLQKLQRVSENMVTLFWKQCGFNVTVSARGFLYFIHISHFLLKE